MSAVIECSLSVKANQRRPKESHDAKLMVVVRMLNVGQPGLVSRNASVLNADLAARSHDAHFPFE